MSKRVVPRLYKDRRLGSEKWYWDGQLHRDDGPAVLFKDGGFAYYQYGKLHRVDGPALRQKDRSTWYYQEGKMHRDGGPAIVASVGLRIWVQHGVKHRVDGPATYWDHFDESAIRSDPELLRAYRPHLNIVEVWHQRGRLHRTDGPAIIRREGFIREWWVNGTPITSEVEDWMRKLRISWPDDWCQEIQTQFILTWG